MTDKKAEFLQAVAKCRDGARGADLPLATREHDRIRQACRRAGLVVHENRGSGKLWFITDAGRAALAT